MSLPSRSQDRLVIHRLEHASDLTSLAEDVRAGLTSTPKTLKPKYFYDELGSRLFEAICCLPEYYLTRAESEILRTRADEIVSAVRGPVRLVELGSGSAEKTRFLIEALLARQQKLHYLPIDISDASLERSSAVLLESYPGISITAYAADYFTAISALSGTIGRDGDSVRTMALFLGSNIGNFDPAEARAFLREVRKMLGPEDGLLVGADLKKSPAVLVPAYDDALGVTAAFNLNLLVRINRELDGDFDLTKFEHSAIYNEARGRMEVHMISRAAHRVHIRAIDLEVEFEKGESIHTESSYKYDLSQLGELAAKSGFRLEKSWLDSGERFSFNLFAAANTSS
ncbi:MAG TPA: L-histidine N(alpha)-methyltransferase [Blastocatellia bacterium]|nr:L-histidine N(alpha)-methyltransferase [Blastocatellia bacterium]